MLARPLSPPMKRSSWRRSRATPWNWRWRSTPRWPRWVQLNVLRSPNAEEQTSITFYNYDRKLSFWYDTRGVVCLDGSRSSTLPDVWVRPPERAEMERGGETLKLRVFVDRSVVEVFVNGNCTSPCGSIRAAKTASASRSAPKARMPC